MNDPQLPRHALESLVRDRAIMGEIRNHLNQESRLPGLESTRAPIPSEGLESTISDPDRLRGEPGLEAIVLLYGRPALLVQDGTFEIPPSDVWRARLYPSRLNLERAISAVGRVEVVNHRTHRWVGTAWMIGEGVAVTNRHVAEEFARWQGDGFGFVTGADATNPIGAWVNFREEYARFAVQEVQIAEILDIAEGPDMAILRLASGEGLPPIPMAGHFDYRDRARYVAAIGYPAYDERNSTEAMRRIFGSIYDVKRLSPGVVAEEGTEGLFLHDCTTLGGNSGSVIVEVDTGHAVGLHFAGAYQEANYALKASVLLERLSRPSLVQSLDRAIGPAPEPPLPFDVAEGVPLNRDGYREEFLGPVVPLPKLSEDLERFAARLEVPKEGRAPYVLDYRHFSLVMNGRRRLPYFTAVNIDGRHAVNIRRGGRETWSYDLRIDKKFQAGNELYKGNRLDRGHLVRRLDPVWGEFEVAKEAEEDTFHFTNCSPQHEALNQRTWLGLEDYVLTHAARERLRVSVFTGPVFQPDDPVYRTIQLPRRFWKVVVTADDAGEVTATAYVLSQADLLTRIEFTYGQYETYQVTVDSIERETGLSFGELRHRDPLSRREGPATVRHLALPEEAIL